MDIDMSMDMGEDMDLNIKMDEENIKGLSQHMNALSNVYTLHFNLGNISNNMDVNI